MTKKFYLDIGYVTVPEANKMVLRYLRIINQNDKSHYIKILAGAKEGLFGGKKHGTRMYQVRKSDINAYAEDIQVESSLEKFERRNRLFTIDKKDVDKIRYCLIFLKFHGIIAEEAYLQGEKNLEMKLKMNEFQRINQ